MLWPGFLAVLLSLFRFEYVGNAVISNMSYKYSKTNQQACISNNLDIKEKEVTTFSFPLLRAPHVLLIIKLRYSVAYWQMLQTNNIWKHDRIAALQITHQLQPNATKHTHTQIKLQIVFHLQLIFSPSDVFCLHQHGTTKINNCNESRWLLARKLKIPTNEKETKFFPAFVFLQLVVCSPSRPFGMFKLHRNYFQYVEAIFKNRQESKSAEIVNWNQSNELDSFGKCSIRNPLI